MIHKILVTGAFGLVGSDLVPALAEKYGKNNIIALSHRSTHTEWNGIIEHGDVTDAASIESIIKKYGISQIYHLAGLLSGGSEQNPQLAWNINYLSVKHVLDLAVKYGVQVFWPSSIAAFGPTTPKIHTPQHTILEPNTMYGVNKVSGELLCQYYNVKYKVDVRSLRYPGLIGYKAPPGAGTTEYAIQIFYDAIKMKTFSCFLKEDTVLPMMYMDDAVRGTIELMEAPASQITIRTSYNFSAIHFTPSDIAAAIKRIDPDFEITYEPDFHQAIADSWPQSIDDTPARNDWGWKHEYTLDKMAVIMYQKIKEKLDNSN